MKHSDNNEMKTNGRGQKKWGKLSCTPSSFSSRNASSHLPQQEENMQGNDPPKNQENRSEKS